MGKKVFISAGHGGSDPGALSYNKKYEEADFNLAISLQVKAELERHGVEVMINRTTDVRITSDNNAKLCNEFDPDLAVDIHNNSATNTSAKGAEVFYSILGGAGKTLATNIQNELVGIGQTDRGIKTRKNSAGNDYFVFIRTTEAPAVIVECGFMSNPIDVANMDEAAEQAKFGVAIAKGILKTLGIEYKKPETVIYKVQVGAYGLKSNADNMVKKLKAAGFDAIIVEQKG